MFVIVVIIVVVVVVACNVTEPVECKKRGRGPTLFFGLRMRNFCN